MRSKKCSYDLHVGFLIIIILSPSTLYGGAFTHVPPHVLAASEQVGEQELTLPVGEVYQRGEHTRGYGKEYIKATTGLIAEEITHALKNAESVGDHTDVTDEPWWDDRYTEFLIHLELANPVGPRYRRGVGARRHRGRRRESDRHSNRRVVLVHLGRRKRLERPSDERPGRPRVAGAR